MIQKEYTISILRDKNMLGMQLRLLLAKNTFGPEDGSSRFL
jgi:hypothetical protein